MNDLYTMSTVVESSAQVSCLTKVGRMVRGTMGEIKPEASTV